MEIRTDTPPNLEIVGGTLQSTTRPKALSVRADAIATSCDGRPSAGRAVNIEWVLSQVLDDGSLVATGQASTSSDQRYFKLPGYSLEAATEYTLAVSAIDVAAGTNVTSTAALSVLRTDVVAFISGGDRVLPNSGIVELSAADSYDEDVEGAFGTDAGLSFAWSCDDASVNTLLQAAGSNAETVAFDGADLGIGRFVFSLNATANDGRSASTTVTYDVIDGDPPAVAIDASAVGARIPATTKVILYGEASPSSLGRDVASSRTFNTTWHVVEGPLEGGASLDYWARTALALSGPARDREHDLVIASGSLVRARPCARLVAAPDGSAVGAASASFTTARTPSSGKIVASPTSGCALETLFAFLAQLGPRDAPLHRFQDANKWSREHLTVSDATAEVAASSSRRARKCNHRCRCLGRARRLVGGRSLQVAQTQATGAALANLLQGSLTMHGAQQHGRVCQTVVAATMAASGDASPSTLIDAVGQVAGGLGADGRSSNDVVALTSVASNGSGLIASAAAWALDALGLAGSSTGIGITAVAAAGLGIRCRISSTSALHRERGKRVREHVERRRVLGSAVDGLVCATLRRSGR